MFKTRCLFVLSLGISSIPAGAAGLAEDLDPTPYHESSIEIDVDEGVTDPRGDESPNPRAEDLVCENVVCGDQGPSCATCGKPAQ